MVYRDEALQKLGFFGGPHKEDYSRLGLSLESPRN